MYGCIFQLFNFICSWMDLQNVHFFQIPLLQMFVHQTEEQVPPWRLLQAQRERYTEDLVRDHSAVLRPSHAAWSAHEGGGGKAGQTAACLRHVWTCLWGHCSAPEQVPQLRRRVLDGEARIEHHFSCGCDPQDEQRHREVRIDLILQ